jgi:hypothetical protein
VSRKSGIIIGCLVLVLAGCNLPQASAPAGQAPSLPPVAATAAPPTPIGTTESPPGVTVTESPVAIGAQEAILILEPGPGSRLVSPLHLAGMADPAHEQTLVVRGLRLDGSELIAAQPIIIAAPLGERGPFEIEIPFSVSQDQQAFIQVYAQSGRDGGITHLASVGVMLSASGPANIAPWSSYPEQIVIMAPTIGQTLSGGAAHIEGVGIASFEGTFVLDILDSSGTVVGSQPVIVSAPDLGLPGTFSADVAYSVVSAGPGRVVVRDPSPAFGGHVHLASVEVHLIP